MEGFLPLLEVTSLSRDYLSLKVTKYFTDIITYLCLLYFMQNLQNYLLQPHFSIYYQFMLIMQNSTSRDSFKLLLQHFHHIFSKSTHDKL